MRTARAWRLTKTFSRRVLTTLAAENGRGLADKISSGSPADGIFARRVLTSSSVNGGQSGCDQRAVQSVRFCCLVQLNSLRHYLLERVVGSRA